MTHKRWSKLVATTALLAGIVIGLAVESLAQNGEMMAAITEATGQNFPEVVVSAAVMDPSGPVEGLTADDFRLLEDGAEVDRTSLAVESSTLENLRLVLALDISVPDSDLVEVKEAAAGLIERLGPKDRAAIMSFEDEVDLVRDFTNNTDELRGAVDNLTRAGDLTALHEAVIEAAALVEPESGRRAVVIITDRPDNTGTSTPLSRGVEQARAAGAPVYIIGFGPKAPASTSAAAGARQTGGQYLKLPEAGALPAALQDVEQLLRQGYRLTYESQVAADNADHDLTLIVDHQGQEARAEGRFTAVPNAVTITLPGLSEGQAVSGLVELRPQVTAPAGVASVEYLLDGQPLATVLEPPFYFEWNSAATTLGLHTLTARAVDNAGNRGQTTIELDVTPSLNVSISAPQSEVQIGREVPISATLETSAPLARMELLVDGEILDSKTAPPYLFDLNSRQYTVGAHEITLRVEDEQGRMAEDSLTLQFLPPPTNSNWFQRFVRNPWVRLSAIIATALTAIAAVLLLAVLLLRMIARWHRRRSQKTLPFEIFNMGNIESRYQLQAKETTGELTFQFAVNGEKLPQHSTTQTLDGTSSNGATPLLTPRPQPVAQVQPAPSQVQPAASQVQPAPEAAESSQAAPPPAKTDSAGVRARVGAGAKGAAEKAGQFQGCLHTVASILDTLALLLPGPAGRAVRGVSQQIYGGQIAVNRAVRAPTQVARTAGHLKSQVSSVGPTRLPARQSSGATPPQPGPITDSGGTTGAAATPMTGQPGSTQPLAPGQTYRPPPGRRRAPGQTKAYLTGVVAWSETPVIESEAKLVLDLLITPGDPFHKQRYPFTITSKSLEAEATPVVSERGEVDMPGMAWFYRYVPGLAVLGSAFILIGWVLWLMFWRLSQMNVLILLLA